MTVTRSAIRGARGLTYLLDLTLAVASAHTPAPGPAEEISLGYGTERRSSSTASVTSLNGGKLQQMSGVSREEMLDQLPGVSVTRQGAGRFSVRIRGIRSNNGSNEPLFAVEGRVVHSTDMITPQSIVRIDVLKDGASLAMYGSRGANGDIVITPIHSR